MFYSNLYVNYAFPLLPRFFCSEIVLVAGGMLLVLAVCHLALWLSISNPSPDSRLLPHRDDSYDR